MEVFGAPSSSSVLWTASANLKDNPNIDPESLTMASSYPFQSLSRLPGVHGWQRFAFHGHVLRSKKNIHLESTFLAVMDGKTNEKFEISSFNSFSLKNPVSKSVNSSILSSVSKNMSSRLHFGAEEAEFGKRRIWQPWQINEKIKKEWNTIQCRSHYISSGTSFSSEEHIGELCTEMEEEKGDCLSLSECENFEDTVLESVSSFEKKGEESERVKKVEYAVLNFYHFAEIENPHEEVERHRDFMKGMDFYGRIYINEQGINAQLSGPLEGVLAYGEWVKTDCRFEEMLLQISPSPGGHSFPRLKLRYKPSLVQVEGGTAHLPLADPAQRAIPLSPQQWRERIEAASQSGEKENSSFYNFSHSGGSESSFESRTTGEGGEGEGEGELEGEGKGGREKGGSDDLELRREKALALMKEARDVSVRSSISEEEFSNSKRKVLLLDVRNGYEWDVGHFKDAQRPHVDSFRTTDFGLSSDKDLPEDPLAGVDKKTTDILMYCTGGIRCDVYSTILRQKGFENLYTLQGGVARFLKEEGNKHWVGNLFVFDSRLALEAREYKKGALLMNSGDSINDETTNLGETLSDLEENNDSSQSLFAKCVLCDGELVKVHHRNCANLDCNDLFLMCPSCAISTKGCCSTKCMEAPRIRPFLEDAKPYERWHKYRPSTNFPRPAGTLPNRTIKRQNRRALHSQTIEERDTQPTQAIN